jgi:hypothetical protein
MPMLGVHKALLSDKSSAALQIFRRARRYASHEFIMYWTIFTNASSEKAAQKIAYWALEKLKKPDVNIEMFSDVTHGFYCKFIISTSNKSWSEIILESLVMAQLIGKNWVLSGDIESELDAWSNHSNITGIKSIHLTVTP